MTSRSLGFILVRSITLAIFAAAATVSTAAEDADTLPDSGTNGPRIAAYDASKMPGTTPASDACETLIEEGWGLVEPADGAHAPRRLEGEVVTGHVPHGDFYFNHGSEDYNFFVVPDVGNPDANDPLADYSVLLGLGNFETGAGKERGRIEVEWEYGAHVWNDAGSSGYYGFPQWAWPGEGDRVIVEGYWTFDCGHADVEDGYRTEIHPAWFVVTFRNSAKGDIARAANRRGTYAPMGPDDRDFSLVTRADVFLGSYGGEAVDNIFDDDDFLGPEDWWQPVNAKDYEFDILAPPPPAGGGTLVWRAEDPPSSWQVPPGATIPTYTASPYTRADGRMALKVHIAADALPDDLYITFGKIFFVGWDEKVPETEQYRVAFQSIYIWDDLEGIEQASWSLWADSGDQHIFIRNSNGMPDEGDPVEWVCDSDENYMPYCEPDEDSNNVAEGSFDRYVGPGDSLVVSVRAKEGDQPLDENDEGGWAASSFTADEFFGVGSHSVRQQRYTWSGESHPDDCDGPDGACFEIAYSIQKIMTDTSAEILVPAVQYAMDPSRFRGRIFTAGAPDKPRRKLPADFNFTGGGQAWSGVTGDDGIASPAPLLTDPAGDYQLDLRFEGNGLLYGTYTNAQVSVLKDFTSSTLDIPAELRWGHRETITVGLIEPNVGQDEPPLPVVGKPMQVILTGLNDSETYPAALTDAAGRVTIEPLIMLPPGFYEAKACFIEDPWFLGSCSAPVKVKVKPGFALFAKGGTVNVSGQTHQTLGDVHSESGVAISGSLHALSNDPGERLEYATVLSDTSSGSSYNAFKVAPFGVAPEWFVSNYCNGAPSLMGVPVTYINGGWNIKHDTVLAGIYCVTGDVKIQARVSGTGTIISTGVINKVRTAGGDQNLTTADPTGADLLLYAGSGLDKAIILSAPTARWKGNLVAAGGIELSGQTSRLDGTIVGRRTAISGASVIVDGR